MLSLELAAAFVSLSIDRSRFDSDLLDVNRRLQALPDRITIAITASTVGLDAVLAQVSQLHALANQPIIFQVGAQGSLPDAVATSSRAAQMVAANAVVNRAGAVGSATANVPQVDIGLTQLQAAGLQYQGRIQKQSDREGALAQRDVIAAQRDAARAAIAAGTASPIGGPVIDVAGQRQAARAAIAAGTASDIRGPTIDVGLASLQASGLKLQTQMERAAARGPTIDVGLGTLAASGLKMQDRIRKESEEAEEAATKAASRAAQQRSARMQANVSQFGMGLGMATGLPLAFSPAMMAGTAVGGTVAGSVRTAMEMESQFAELRRVTGMNAAQSATFQTQLMRFGATTGGASTGDLVRMAQIGGQAGVYDPEKQGGPERSSAALMKFVQDLARVKLAMSDMDTETLANQMAKVLHVMDLGVDKTAGFGSALNRLAAMSTASGSEILDVTNRIAGFAHSAEMTIPQITALGSVMIDVGFTPEIAGSAAQRLFTLMSSKSADTAKAIGISAKEMRAALEQGPLVALQLVLNKLNETGGTVAKQELIKELGLPSGAASRLLQAVSGQMPEVERRAGIAAEEMRTEASLGTTAAEMGATAGANVQQLQNAFTALQAELGVHFIPVVKDAVQGMTALVGAISLFTGKAGAEAAKQLPGETPEAFQIRAALAKKGQEDAARRASIDEDPEGGNLVSRMFHRATAATTMLGTEGLFGRTMASVFGGGGITPEEQQQTAAVQHAGVIGMWQRAQAPELMANLAAPIPALEKLMAAAQVPAAPTGQAQEQRESAQPLWTREQFRAPWDFMHSVRERLLGPDKDKQVGGLFGTIGDTGHMVRQQMGHLHAVPTPRHLDAGLSAADVGKRLQEAALNKDDEKERKKIELMTQNNGILTTIKGLLGAGLGRSRSIIEGGHGTTGHK
jgi:TP901 family phage tail tape measure protein